MLSTEITNIPISISILYEREYNNLCVMYKIFDKKNKRRAISEKSINSNQKINNYYNNRSITPKIESYRVLKN